MTFKKCLSFLVLCGVFLSCTEDKESITETEGLDYQKLSSKIEVGLELPMSNFENVNTMLSALESTSNSVLAKNSDDENVIYVNVDLDSDVVEYSKQDIPDIYSEKQSEFLLEYLNKVANVENSELLYVVSTYKDKLESSGIISEQYDQLYFLLDSSEQAVIAIEEALSNNSTSKDANGLTLRSESDCFWDCMGSHGKDIARGMVGGALAGAGTGALLGAGGGTVVFPILGTATGAVAGAVFGGAEGAIYGASTTALWAAADCGQKCARQVGLAAGSGCVNQRTNVGSHGMVFSICTSEENY